MFNKKSDDGAELDRAEPVVRQAPNVSKRKTSVIGPTLRFKGELSANEDLIIEGQIEGVIAHHDKNLTVGKEGRVKADITARAVEIYGYVEGDVRGEESVKLAESAVVKGNIYCARIIMANGAKFTGTVDMSQRTKAPAKPAATPQIKQPGETVNMAVGQKRPTR
jgi:cytoskeletal protein CcmA (bactofilin family)